MNAALPEVGLRRRRSLDHPDRRPRTPRPDLEERDPISALLVLVRELETQDFREYPRCRSEVTNGQVHCPKAPYTELLWHGGFLPGNAALHARGLALVREPETLALGVEKVDKGTPVALLDATVPDPVLRKSPSPPVQGFATAHPELCRRHLARSRMVLGDPEMRPVEKGNLRPGLPNSSP
jgi:hypothetical protein